MKKLAQRRAAEHRAATVEENEIVAQKRSAVDTSRSSPSAPAQVADASLVLDTGIATLVSPVPLSNRANDRLTSDRITPRQVHVETLLAAAPAVGEVVVASAPSAPPFAFPAAEASDDGWGWRWLGVLLMALGLASVLGSSRALQRVVPLDHQQS